MLSLLPTLASDLLPFAALLLLAWLRPDLVERSSIIPRLDRLGGKAPLVAALVTFLIGLGLTGVRPPHPEIHDEFSYLLASDTFASGRLTNPRPPSWHSFESPHVLTTPTRQSKYPPSKGLLLALGQVLTGHPIVGVWIGMAGAAAALVWALIARFSPGWAFFGGMLPAIRFGVFKWDADLSWAYWLESYWGGELGLLGGALVLGAALRLLRRPERRAALVLGLGTAVLAANRPYEGVVVVLTIVLVLLLRLPSPTGLLGRVRTLAPALAAPILVLVGLAAYSDAVVGNPWTLPHVVYTDQYQHVGHFVWSSNLDPEFTPDSRIGRFHLSFGKARLEQLEADGGGIRPLNLALQAGFFLGAALLLVLPLVIFDLRHDAVWLSLILFAMASAGNSVITVSTLHPHYFGPVSPVFIVLSLAAIGRVRPWRFQGRPIGKALSEAFVVACVLTFVVSVSLRAALYEAPQPFPASRHEINTRLASTPKPDLVIVSYSPNYPGGLEWVYSPADLDSGAVVWAHDLGERQNRELIASFPGREVWRLTMGGGIDRLEPYSPRDSGDSDGYPK